jgi:hypothetical protein
MSLRWTAVLCISILILAIAYVAGVLFLAGSFGGSTGQVASVKPPLASKTKILSTSAGTLSTAGMSGGSTGQNPTGKPLASKTKILSNASGIALLQETTEMQPTEPNMTVIARTGGNLSYSGSNVEVDVTNPPLLIDLTVIPKIVVETKWFVNRTLTRNEEIVQVPVVSRSSFANISVIEKETGRIIALEGFGRDNSIDQIRAIKIFEPGKFLVQVYGNDVAVEALISMRTPVQMS